MSNECCHEEISEEPECTCPYCSGKHKERDDAEKKDLMNRLKRIEGQVRGVEGMLESGSQVHSTVSTKYYLEIT